MNSKTVFLGGGKSIKLGDGDDEIFNCTINIDKIKENECIENYKGNRFVRITIAKRSEPDQYGKDVYIKWNPMPKPDNEV
jgi:hypothetical protein